ncbi:MAG: pilus assembly protein N-terminal domain-containing protein, partial [Candidatus Omnitrophica bacterium]|nr:pilus assembly protein N-terminal domain-containing protein [Candidatus Omnitrophota bacterium]
MKKMQLIFAGVMLVGLLALPGSGTAVDGGLPDELILYMGEVKIFPVSNLKRIAVSNPKIADVTNISGSEVTLVPKAAGATTLMIWDNFGEQSFDLKVYSERTTELKRRIDSILAKLDLPQLYTVAEDEEGKVMLMGRVKTPQDRERVVVALGPLYEKAVDVIEVKEEEGVVNIDVQVLELDRDGTSTLGLSWPGQITITEVGSPGLTGTKLGQMWSVLNFSRTALSVTIDALVQEGKARILSRPRLSCQSGKEAELLVGGEKPILTTDIVSGGGSTTDVDYKEFGIKLNIKPTITDTLTKRIKLAVMVEVKDVEEAVVLGPENAPTALAYPFSTRNASTELFLDDGQTLSIGGLIKQKKEEDVRKVPFLGDIPVLGLLFRQKVTKVGGGQGER